MIRYALTACAVLATCPAASAQSDTNYWYLGMSGTNGEGNTVTIVDANRIVGSGNIRRAWVEGYFSSASASRGIRHMRNLNEYDCAERRSRSVQLTAYFFDPTESPVTSAGDMTWEYVVPGTSGESVLNFVCGSRDEQQYVELDSQWSSAEAAARIFELADQIR